MTPEQVQQLNEVYAFMQSMKSNTTIPFDVRSALISAFAKTAIKTSARAGSSIAKSVLTSTTPTYTSVSDEPTGFITVAINGTSYDIPYFS